MVFCDFLMEIYCEEIPARMQNDAARNMLNIMVDMLGDAGLVCQNAETFVTPRRLVFKGSIPKSTEKTSEERRGPKITAPEKAIDGFLKSCGLNRSDVTERDGYLYAAMETPEKQSCDILPNIIDALITKFPWPKTMRYPGAASPWVRPIQNVCILLDHAHIDAFLPSCGKNTRNVTYGHRTMSTCDEISIASFNDYHAALENNFVILHHADRKNKIENDLLNLAKEHNCTYIPDDGLLNEVAGLSEYPIMRMGHIHEKFMDIPKCILMTSMRVHQKYFAFERDGKLAPFFGVATDHNPKNPDVMMAGFDRVLRARLEDAAFFLKRDQSTPLLDRLPKLDAVVFQEKLGSMGDKIRRLVSVLTTDDEKMAAQLMKCDLVTDIVGEFPELQGEMGRIYAHLHHGADIANAIPDHYKPLGPSDAVPTSHIGIQLALRDKIDTLTGFFGVGLKPSGSKDPFALRRTALGIIRILIENEMNVNAIDIMHDAIAAYANQNIHLDDDVKNHVIAFLTDRLGAYLKDRDIPTPVLRGVLNARNATENFDIFDIFKCCDAVSTILQTTQGTILKAAHKRANGVYKQSGADTIAVNIDLFEHQAEHDLFNQIQNITPKIEHAVGAQDYKTAMECIAALQPAITGFFDCVMVNVEDENIQNNRLALLALFLSTCDRIADFSQTEV